jgi:hypothetical protein
VQAAPFENRHLLAKIGDFYDRLKDSYDERFYQQEVLGEYVSMEGGRVYSAFDRRTHIRPVTVDQRVPLWWALDFNVDPLSSVIVQRVGGIVQVVGEIVLRHSTTIEACAEFLKRHGKHPAGVCVYGDAAGNSQQTTGATDYDMIQEYFAVHSETRVDYRVPKANPSVKERVNLTNRQLKSASGKVGLAIDPECRELINDLEQVCYKADTNLIDKDRDRMRTHLSDALGYVLWQECRPVPKIGEQSRPLLSF